MPVKNVSPVVNPWLIAGLIMALAGNVLLSAALIVKLSHFDDAKIQADEVEAQTAKKHAELSSVQSEVETWTKRKEMLQPTIADWQQRLEEKTTAEAALKSLEAKKRQTESDIAQAGKRILGSPARTARARATDTTRQQDGGDHQDSSLREARGGVAVISRRGVVTHELLTPPPA